MEIMGKLKPPNPCHQVPPLAQPIGLRKQKAIRVNSETWAADRFLTPALLPLQRPVWVQEHLSPPHQQGALEPQRRPAGKTHKQGLGET